MTDVDPLYDFIQDTQERAQRQKEINNFQKIEEELEVIGTVENSMHLNKDNEYNRKLLHALSEAERGFNASIFLLAMRGPSNLSHTESLLASLEHAISQHEAYADLSERLSKVTGKRDTSKILRVGIAIVSLLSLLVSLKLWSLSRAVTTGRVFDGRILRKQEWSGKSFVGSSLVQVNLNSSDMRNTNLEKVPLSGSTMTNTDLQGAYLNEALLDNVNLKYANLSSTSLIGTHLFGSDLEGASLNFATLDSSTDLRGANMKNTTLVETNLGNVDLSAVLNLSPQLLLRSDYSQAICPGQISCTKWITLQENTEHRKENLPNIDLIFPKYDPSKEGM